jgi:methylenetetrahydrofolate dehydrogenase (NADP+)/methenyltetrahydrofolate cyclohydrolase/formyltetrahydrofolate synthetase
MTTTAEIINGKVIAEQLRTALIQKVKDLKAVNVTPHLSVVQVGGRPDSSIYVKMKGQESSKIGIDFTHKTLPENVTQQSVKNI